MARRLIHFLVLGALLLAIDVWRRPESPPEDRELIVISEAEVLELGRGWIRRFGSPPDERELNALLSRRADEEMMVRVGLDLDLHRTDPVIVRRLVQNMQFMDDAEAEAGVAPGKPAAIEAEIVVDKSQWPRLYRQALALGMHETDPVVRRRMVQRIELMLRKSRAAPDPDDEELLLWAQQHPERFESPARVTLHQVFLSGSRRGAEPARAAAEQRAKELAASGAAPEAAVAAGDPSSLPTHLTGSAEHDIAKQFGPGFASAVMALEPGVWSEPIESPYGWHVVMVSEVIPAGLAPFPQIRNQVLLSWRGDQESVALREGLARLRRRYEVRREGETEAVPLEAAFGRGETSS